MEAVKRGREENEEEDSFKRQKSLKDIITLFDEEEDDPNHDLSSLISTLQQELSPVVGPPDSQSDPPEEELESVMRHLLEASDDELGIPSTDGSDSAVELGGQVEGGDLLYALEGEGVWEFEDHETANFYYYNHLLLNTGI